MLKETRYSPWDPSLVPKLERRAEALVGTLNAQEVANTLWAYAMTGREPGEGVIQALEGRAEALTDTFNVQNVANTLWAYTRLGREGAWGGYDAGAGEAGGGAGGHGQRAGRGKHTRGEAELRRETDG